MKISNWILLFCSLAGSAAADTTQLKPLVVEAQAIPASKTVPTVQESREELAKTPGGTEVVDAERYLRGRASTLAETFALSPGVVAQARYGGDEARISIRGSGIQRTFHGRGIRLLQDGVPVNLADGGFDMQSTDPLAADHINILRGSNALSLGSSTLGGAIDYISKTGLTAPGGSIRLEAGLFDYLRARVAEGLSEGNFDAYVSLSEQFQQGFRDHAEQNNQRLFSNFGWKISDHAETRLFVTAVNTVSELPGNLTKAEMRNDPSQADQSFFGAVRYDNHRDYQLFRVADKTTVTNGDNTLEFVAAFTYKDLDHPITPFYGVIDQLSKDSLFGATFTNTSQLLGHDNRFRSSVSVTYGAIDAAVFHNNFGKRGSMFLDADQTAINYEAFAEDQLALGSGFTGVVGATAAKDYRKNDQLLGSSSASYDRSYQDFSPKVGLRWDAQNFQIFGNVSSSFEPPSFSETNGALTPNRAQTANTVELGTRGSYEAFRWDTTVYASEIQGEFLALNDSHGAPLGTTNADKTTHQGIEIGSEADLLGAAWNDTPEDRLVLRGAWTYGRFQFDDDVTYGNNTLAGLPSQVLRSELTWENKLGYYAGPTTEWVPVGSYVDHANTLKADPYALLGFKFGRRVEKGVSWFVEAKNLTNRTYAATTDVIANAGGADSRSFLPSDGRSVFAGLEWKW
ncbi:MAG: TonB-dependent receptor [Verrucomicrobiota bacterium]